MYVNFIFSLGLNINNSAILNNQKICYCIIVIDNELQQWPLKY